MSSLSGRLHNLVALLQPDSEDGAAILVRQGCAQSLELALLDPTFGLGLSTGVAAATTGGDHNAGEQDEQNR